MQARDYVKGAQYVVIKEGARIIGRIPIHGGYSGGGCTLRVGQVITCEGLNRGWGSDPGMEVNWSDENGEAFKSQTQGHAMHGATFWPLQTAGMSEWPADGYLRKLDVFNELLVESFPTMHNLDFVKRVGESLNQFNWPVTLEYPGYLCRTLQHGFYIAIGPQDDNTWAIQSQHEDGRALGGCEVKADGTDDPNVIAERILREVVRDTTQRALTVLEEDEKHADENSELIATLRDVLAYHQR
jgi:hypothetical protein